MDECPLTLRCRECGRVISERESLGYSMRFDQTEPVLLCSDCRRIPESIEAAPSTKGDDEAP